MSKRKHLLVLCLILVRIILHGANNHECGLVELLSSSGREESPEERTEAGSAEIIDVCGMFHVRSVDVDGALSRGRWWNDSYVRVGSSSKEKCIKYQTR